MFKAQNRYRVCSGYDAVMYINKCLKYSGKLTSEQERELRNEFGDRGMLGNLGMEVQFYVWQDEIVNGKNWMWRCTVPVFLIFVLLFHIFVEPIHWVFTGKRSLGRDSKILGFLISWNDNIFYGRR